MGGRLRGRIERSGAGTGARANVVRLTIRAVLADIALTDELVNSALEGR